MNPVRATAPGKLFLLGEYAVLDSCPAIVVAVEPGVRVLAAPKQHAGGIQICLPQYGERWFLGNDNPPPSVRGVLPFVGACLAALSNEERWQLSTGLELHIEFPAYFGQPQKVGLGGSAALVSAVSAALLGCCYGANAANQARAAIYERALAAHRQAQHGRGSGGDVAASVFGGAILFEPDRQEGPITRLDWPETIRIVTAWSGRSASTAELIQAYERTKRAHPVAHQRFLDDSTEAVATFASALHGNGEAIRAWSRAAEVLPAFASEADLPYLTPELQELLRAATRSGHIAKPSGAGGGDCVVALSEANGTDCLVRAWQRLGFPVLVASPSSQGVACEQA